MSRGHAITIDLPRENPFGEQPARGNRSSGQTTGRSHQSNRPPVGRQAGGRGVTRAQDTDDADSFDESYGGRQGNVVVLPDVNPFGQDDTPRNARSGGQASGRPSARGEPRARAGGNGNQGRGVTVLASDNPFGRTGNRNGPRIVEYQPTESEPEEDEEEEEEEEQTQDDEEEEYDYPPPPEPVRRANTARAEQPSRRISNQDRGHPNGGQRAANSRNRSRAADAQADDRLVISWVDDVPVSPPRSPAHAHGHHHSSDNNTDSESYFTLRPNGPRSERSVSPGGRVHRSHSHNHRDRHSHHHHGHHDHHHHDRFCRECHRLAIPAWQPPFPMPPADWSGYGAPRSPYSPAPPYLYGHPLYANIPHMPSLLDQCRAPYPPLPVAPVAFLRDLQAQSSQGATSPLQAVPAVPQLPGPAKLEEWKHVLEFLVGNKSQLFMPKLQAEIFDSAPTDRVFRRLTSTVQVRFAERQGTEIINRVHLVPRGSLAMGTVMAGNPKIDVDLVIPSDFILRRWNVTASETDDLRPRTIADALDLHPASINRGEVETAKLQWVIQAVWEQINGSADGFIFPGGREEAERYLPRDWCNRHKESVSDSNRLRLITVGGIPPLKINVFVKVSLSLYGQDMIVGVDRASAKGPSSFQLVKTYRTPGVPLSEPTLSPNLRTAIQLLCWSQSLLKIDIPGVPKLPTIRSSHFHLALTALQQLSPSDKLYVAQSSLPEPFSLRVVLQVVVKILSFLDRAYQTPIMLPSVGGGNGSLVPTMQLAFPLGSCTIADTLSLQFPATIQLAIKAALTQFFPIEKTLSALSFESVLDSLSGVAVDAAAGAAATKDLASTADTALIGDSSGQPKDGATGGDALTSETSDPGQAREEAGVVENSSVKDGNSPSRAVSKAGSVVSAAGPSDPLKGKASDKPLKSDQSSNGAGSLVGNRKQRVQK